MLLKRFEDVTEFYSRVEVYLVAREAEHNLMLGLCTTMMRANPFELPPYLAYVEDAGEIVAVALRTPPHNLILSHLKDEYALPLIADDVLAVYGEIPGALGPKPVVAAFVTLWSQLSGQPHQLEIAERVYRLEKVNPIVGVPGEQRDATHADRELMIEWMMAFAAEALTPMPREEAERSVDIRLDSDPSLRGMRFWWDSGQAVSMAGYAGPTPNGIRVGPVYTPPEVRGRGYASACVAALSQELLDRGHRFCFLFTDLSNPTSNHIYQMIGYQPVADVDMYRFGEQGE